MEQTYSTQVCRQLGERFEQSALYRPMRVQRYEPGDVLEYTVEAVPGPGTALVRLAVERFVGGGFAGQVYRVKILEIRSSEGTVGGLETDGVFAMKILVPPSRRSLFFRNMLYRVGFQGPFQPQVNPQAARAGALMQKLIRAAAGLRLGSESSVVDIYATFVDERLGSCGELSQWVDGRTWLLEVDDRVDLLKRWIKGRAVEEEMLGSPEYRHKRRFMADLVAMLHEMGAGELARQYEWSTCKSQPNCLKYRNECEGDLVAVDFRAGLALLFFLPMSPGDFRLIAAGITRGSLVQFDRPDTDALTQFVERNISGFSDPESVRRSLAALTVSDRIYRDSLPDVTHHIGRLFYCGRLWAGIRKAMIAGWRTTGLLDVASEQTLCRSRARTVMFAVLGMLPFIGRTVRRWWGRPDWRRHYASLLGEPGYFARALQGRIAEKLTTWHRSGRIGTRRTLRIADRPALFFLHLPLSLLPAGLHRLLTDLDYARGRAAYILVRPFRLYFNAHLRTQWLRDMVQAGRGKHMLSDRDADTILAQVDESYIQKYLVSLVVHFLTLPVTQIVSIAVAYFYVRTHGEMSTIEKSMAAGGILVAFQVMPVSPGSFVRGLYTLGLVIRERNLRDYNIAVALSFFKYVGYLAFPIQMTHRYPALARFMACHWATEAVHVVPVFGERGALLEHWVFRLFYNWPLTVRRRMLSRDRARAEIKSRYLHVVFLAAAAAIILAGVDLLYHQWEELVPRIRDIWPLMVLVPSLVGIAVTLWCGGAARWKRIAAAAACGVLSALLYCIVSYLWHLGALHEVPVRYIAKAFFWRGFIWAILGAIAAMVTEIKMPDPLLSGSNGRGRFSHL